MQAHSSHSGHNCCRKMYLIYASILLILSSMTADAALPCNKRRVGGTSFVCVCSISKRCDTIDPINSGASGTYTFYASDRENLRFASKSGHFRRKHYAYDMRSITINRNAKQQEMLGFGGAFTDAATKNVLSLPASLQNDLLQSYFGPTGIEYNLGRVPIGCTDFSTHGYTYDDSEYEDGNLEQFALQREDLQWKIPMIKRAMALQPKLELLASAWTAPKWMKTNGKYTEGYIKPKFYHSWAQYYLRFFEEYKKHGINFWAVTTGNEPSLVLMSSSINTVGWPVSRLKRWIEENFGPTIRNSSFSHLKIFILDDQRFFLPWYPSYMLRDASKEIVDGIALHWYWDRLIPAFVLDTTHSKFPDKILLNSESCRGEKAWEPGVMLGDWSRAEDYAHGILEDFNHHVQGWIDWNLALNTSGGPTYISNEVDSPILVDAEAREFYKQPIFYSLAHFSKFIPRGSRKIAHSTDAHLEVAAFQRPDRGIVVVMHNRQPTSQTVVVKDNEVGQIELQLTAKSINTLVYW